MKQILQSLKNGDIELAKLPCPTVQSGQLLIQTSRTLISGGTERMLVNFGKSSFIEKARTQPDKVRMVLDKVKTDGLLPTVESVVRKLDQPLSLGYCNVGIVSRMGEGVSGFAVGDRVASNGKHAELVSVPQNLCAKIPTNVSDDEAAFTVIGAIALEGIRLVRPTLGETVVVTGLGLVGLMTVQLLRAQGCRVLGIDFSEERLVLARQFGAEVVDLSVGQDPLAVAAIFSRGRGVDAVIITAAAKSNEPMHQAALMCRKRGRIVLVGVTGLALSRDDFYQKELTFQVSCSYGPGRYDSNYEEKGIDYPVGFVRWTAQRNFEAVLDMMADGRMDVKPLISHRFDIENAENAYALVTGSEPSLGILLQYPAKENGWDGETFQTTIRLTHVARPTMKQSSSLAVIGAGNYGAAVLIPAFKAAGAHLKTLVSKGGISGFYAARRFGFEETSTTTEHIFADPDIKGIVVATRHHSHASFILKALAARKHVFVEKPLCMTLDELDRIQAAYLSAGVILMVGFNRRFAPQIQKMKHLLASRKGPKSFVITVNAGAVPPDHWTQDLAIGGGRVIGEACHFIDLLRFLANSTITHYTILPMVSLTGDTIVINLQFADGSLGVIHYLANGHKSFPKERLEVFAGGYVLQLDNFRRLRGFGWPAFRKMNLWRQEKGQKACALAFVRALEQGQAAPIPFEEIIEVSRVTIELANVLRGMAS